MSFLKRSALIVATLGSHIPATARAAGVPDPVKPAHVVHTNTNKQGYYAVFDQGARTGFVIGRDVCIYDTNRVKIKCATVVRAKSRAAAVQLDAGDQKTIRNGFYGWPQDLGEPVFSDHESDKLDAKTSAEVKELVQQEDDPPEPVLPPVLVNRWSARFAPSYALPVWMNDLRFNAGARSSGTGKIWDSGDTIKGTAVGFSARINRALAGKGDSAWDLSYYFVPQKPVRDDFDLTDGSIFVQSDVWGHQLRARWLRGATWKHTETSDFLMYTGFGYDFLYAKFKSSKIGTSTEELVSGATMGHGFEIPVVFEYESYGGSWRWVAGLDLAMPLGVFGKKTTGKLSYSDDTADADKSLGAVQKAINIRRGWFAASVHCGIGRSL